ncbi:transglutaminase domain-containing protein [Alteribacter natronophilus]|uniref:transglutaminase domain-containing protein n=1 Tax=Alteribacter natronophilus TaxID=2583810 RepID=UPI00110DDE7B|nr:transglutaminase-like domain-containing protein [Alteribacter natronophilus]TMW70880.1 transglutaminase domain-containing protein [Alteribacter natronophilus]
MGKRFTGIAAAAALTASVLAGCGADDEETAAGTPAENEADEAEEQADEGESGSGDDSIEALSEKQGIELEALELYDDYADEIGLTFTSPEYGRFATGETVVLEGRINEMEELHSDHLWIRMNYTEPGEKLFATDFTYYVPIEDDGTFSSELTLHSGKGQYRIGVLAPSNKPDEDNQYYDVASIYPYNMEEELSREVEYTRRGLEEELSITSPGGYLEAEGTFTLAGDVPNAEDGHFVMVQVREFGNAFNSNDMMIPVHDGQFERELPLYYGENLHFVEVKVFDPEEELYYDSANLFVKNESDEQFIQIEETREAHERGIALTHPSPSEPLEYTGDEAYRIAGEINPDIAHADEIELLYVTTKLGTEEATYLIDVEDYRFDDDIWLRFGEGEYEITLSVPEVGHDRSWSMTYYSAITLTQEVTGLEDKRSLLPSRSIQSDHPDIIAHAEKVTEGLDDDRDIAKAVYDWLAENIAYDIAKWRDDTFEYDDSALKTLETLEGVCQDYAFLAVAMFRSLGMEANYVSGYTNVRHAWVDVKVDGEWLEMDPTWGAGYVEGDEFTFQYNEDYFDPDEEMLAETHRRIDVMY